MKDSILGKLQMLEERFQELEALLSDGDIITDQTKYRELSKEYAELEPVVKNYTAYEAVVSDMHAAALLVKDLDQDMR